jgi:glutathione S-transferase
MSLRERLAELQHEQWIVRIEEMLPHMGSQRKHHEWNRQMNTPYAELPEENKERARKDADRILDAIATWQREQQTLGGT